MSDKRHFSSKVFDQLLGHATIDWTVQYSTVRSWFDCFDGLPFGLVYHLGVWKLAHASQLYLLHINLDETKTIKKLYLNWMTPSDGRWYSALPLQIHPKHIHIFNQIKMIHKILNAIKWIEKQHENIFEQFFALISKLADKSTFVSVRKRHGVSMYQSTLRTL